MKYFTNTLFVNKNNIIAITNDKDNNNSFDKDATINTIKELINDSKEKRIERDIDSKNEKYTKFNCHLTLDNNENKEFDIVISNIKENEKLIEEFDNYKNIDSQKENNKKLDKKKIIFISAGIAAFILTTTMAFCKIHSDDIELQKKYFNLSKLEREMRIHAGVEHVEGTKVNPYLDHNCALGTPNDGTVEERIAKYCDKKNMEYLVDEALEKYELYYNDKYNDAEKINLKKLVRNHK